MLRELRPALIVFGALTLVTGVVYPAIVTLVGALAFPAAAGGSLVEREGRVVGSRLVGQPLSSPG
jgi:K+-transporting ATPase ATPase C chain